MKGRPWACKTSGAHRQTSQHGGRGVVHKQGCLATSYPCVLANAQCPALQYRAAQRCSPFIWTRIPPRLQGREDVLRAHGGQQHGLPISVLRRAAWPVFRRRLSVQNHRRCSREHRRRRTRGPRAYAAAAASGAGATLRAAGARAGTAHCAETRHGALRIMLSTSGLHRHHIVRRLAVSQAVQGPQVHMRVVPLVRQHTKRSPRCNRRAERDCGEESATGLGGGSSQRRARCCEATRCERWACLRRKRQQTHGGSTCGWWSRCRSFIRSSLPPTRCSGSTSGCDESMCKAEWGGTCSSVTASVYRQHGIEAHAVQRLPQCFCCLQHTLCQLHRMYGHEHQQAAIRMLAPRQALCTAIQRSHELL